MNFQNFIEKNLYNRTLFSYLLYPISLKYAFLQRLRRKVYQLFPSLSYKSRIKIISIGNIVSGGSGKTPFTIFLAKYLSEKGYKTAVSHRGYKGKFEYENKLISDREQIFRFAEKAGDESFLLAMKLKGIPVIAGKNRKLSIMILEQKFPDLDYIILDDSFQHLKVKHDLDFVIFNEIGGIGNGFVLPAGILRESMSALKFADYIVFNGEEKIPEKLQKYNKIALKGNYQIKKFYDLNKNEIAIEKLKNQKVALLSGIGQPKSFEKTVLDSGLKFEEHFRFPDHFNYKDYGIIRDLKNKVENNKIYYLLTTEKDFMKLQFMENLELPLVVVAVEFCLATNFKLLEIPIG